MTRKAPRLGAALEYTEQVLGGPTVETDTTFSVGTSAVKIAAGNGDRCGLVIINIGNGDSFVNFDAGVSSSNGIRLGANGGSVTMNVTEDFTLQSREWYAVVPSGGPSNHLVIEYSRFSFI